MSDMTQWNWHQIGPGDATLRKGFVTTKGNPEPQFIIKNAKIDYWSEVGKGHLKVKISNANYGNIDAIAFGSKGTPLGDIIMNHSGSLIHFAGVIKKNDWQGNKAVQFHIRDLFTA